MRHGQHGAPLLSADSSELYVTTLGRQPSRGMSRKNLSARLHSPAFSHAVMSELYVITLRSQPCALARRIRRCRRFSAAFRQGLCCGKRHARHTRSQQSGHGVASGEAACRVPAKSHGAGGRHSRVRAWSNMRWKVSSTLGRLPALV